MARPVESVQRRHAELVAAIDAADTAYYIADAPHLADATYDALRRELEQLEAAHPELVTPTSPTQRVGAPIAREAANLGEVVHERPMLSLSNAFSPAEVEAFAASAAKALGGREPGQRVHHQEHLASLIAEVFGDAGRHERRAQPHQTRAVVSRPFAVAHSPRGN